MSLERFVGDNHVLLSFPELSAVFILLLYELTLCHTKQKKVGFFLI